MEYNLDKQMDLRSIYDIASGIIAGSAISDLFSEKYMASAEYAACYTIYGSISHY